MSMESMFRTSDLGEAAFLLTRGFGLKGTEQVGPTRIVFIFDAAAKPAALGFWNSEPVPARQFFDAIRDVKTMLFRACNN